MKWNIFKSSPTPTPVESFAATAFSLDHSRGKQPVIVKLPQAPPRNPYSYQNHHKVTDFQHEDGRWKVGGFSCLNAFWQPEEPLEVEASSSSIFLPEDVRITGEVKTEATVRLPYVQQQLTPVGAGTKQAQAPADDDFVYSGNRLRRRGKETHILESIACEHFFDREHCGGKTSDDHVRRYLKVILGREVKVVGSHQVVVKNASATDPEVVDVYLSVEKAGRSLCVSLRLLNKLLLASMFKSKTQELLYSLKAKAMQYGNEIGMGLSYMTMVLSGTVVMAMTANFTEVNAFLAMGGPNGLARQKQSMAMAEGRMPEQYTPGFKGLLKYFVLGKLPEEVVLPRAKT